MAKKIMILFIVLNGLIEFSTVILNPEVQPN